MTPAEVREVQLHTLREFSDWCFDRGLRFQLAFGSLLGAVRHKGFIPWDDDIDLAMPRVDYERFCREFAVGAPDGLEVGSLANIHDWPLAFAKVWSTRTVVDEHTHLPLRAGVGLDVFPIDEVPSRGLARMAHLIATHAGRNVETVSAVRRRQGRAPGKAAVLAVTGPLARRLGPANVARLRTRLARGGRGTHVSIPVGPYYWSVPQASMLATTDVPFENLTAPAPADAAAVLRGIYGDYMTPPPPSRQVTHHAATARWLG